MIDSALITLVVLVLTTFIPMLVVAIYERIEERKKAAEEIKRTIKARYILKTEEKVEENNKVLAKGITAVINDRTVPMIEPQIHPPAKFMISQAEMMFESGMIEPDHKDPEPIDLFRTNCPNCGAPLNDDGKCDFCRTITQHKKPKPPKADKVLVYHNPFEDYDSIRLFADGVEIKSGRVYKHESI